MNKNLMFAYFIALSLLVRDVQVKVLNDFCVSQEKVCQHQKHIACLPLKETNPNIKLMMEVQLNSTSKTKIVTHFNKLRDNYARGYTAHEHRPWGSRKISNMRGLSWDDEMAIIALKSFLNGYGDNNKSFCYTYVTNNTQAGQRFNLFEISNVMLFKGKINDETFPSLLKGLTRKFNINILKDVSTNVFGCAGGVYIQNNKLIKIKLKCMFNRMENSSTKLGTACGDCESWGVDVYCNQHYSGLCGEAKIPHTNFKVEYMSDNIIALAQSTEDGASKNETFLDRVDFYTTHVMQNTKYYLLAYGLFLAIISSILACIWKCRENPMFCLCKTAICCATKKLSNSEDTKAL